MENILHDPFGGSPENWSLAGTIRDEDYETWADELNAQLDADEQEAWERYGNGGE